MNVKVLQLIDGAKKATGTTVIIDVFRAFSLEAYLFSKGVSKIIPTADTETAYRLKREDPDLILAGERGGKILPGFDVGNSPSEIRTLDLKGKTVIHTTSAGTQGIANATSADEILGAGLVNAAATAKYIKKKAPENVSLVCMGLAATEPTDEDTLCATYIKSLLEGKALDLETEIQKLRYTSGAKFFDEAQNAIFPTQDFFMCTKTDVFDFIIKLRSNGTDMPYMVKECV